MCILILLITRSVFCRDIFFQCLLFLLFLRNKVNINSTYFCQLAYQECSIVIVVIELRSNLLRGKHSVVENGYKMRFIFISVMKYIYLIIKMKIKTR